MSQFSGGRHHQPGSPGRRAGGTGQAPSGQAAAPALFAGPNLTCDLANGGARCFGADLIGTPTGQHSYDRGIESSDMGSNLPAVDLGASCGVRSVAVGAYHACALLEDGDVKCWGNNRSGELGQGDADNRTAGKQDLGHHLSPVDLGNHQRATMVSAGLGFSCALLECGSVKCWGDNTYAQLGLGDTVNHGDDAGEMGNALPAVNLGSGRKAKFVAAGHAHACAILDDDSLKCWGLNNYGQLGQGDLRGRGASPADMGDSLHAVDLGAGHHAKSVAIGPYETCALLENNTLKCWGDNAHGNLGLGDIRARGGAPGDMGDSLPVVDLGAQRTAQSVVMGGHFTCAVLDNGQLKCWGDNEFGTLGLGDTARRGDQPGEMGDALPAVNVGSGRTVKRAVGTFYNACAELDNGKIKCWGSSATGMLGIGPSEMVGDQPSDMGDHLQSADLGSCSLKTFAGGFGYHFGCGLLQNGTVKCWGSNSFGQLGVDRSSHAGDEPGDMGSALASVDLGTGRTIRAIAPGYFHTCALLDTGDVKCWGANLSGSLGLGDTMRRDGRASYLGDHLPTVDLGGHHAQALASGSDHTCAILDDGTVKCWGDNENGELGLGDQNNRGDAPGEMGSALPTVDLGAGRTAKALSLGYRHTCALLDNDTIKCWGWNLYGQLGIDVNDDRGDNPGELGDALPAVSLGDKKPIAVHAGYTNTCATFEDGSLKCWGSNVHGELGQGDLRWRGSEPGDMGSALPPINLGAGRTVLKVSVSLEHVCALLDNQTVKCWGYGAFGALGYGDLLDRGGKPTDMGDALSAVSFGDGESATDLAGGWYHSCARLSGGLKCWGWNQYGQLGLGDTRDRGGAAAQMGDQLSFLDLQR